MVHQSWQTFLCSFRSSQLLWTSWKTRAPRSFSTLIQKRFYTTKNGNYLNHKEQLFVYSG